MGVAFTLAISQVDFAPVTTGPYAVDILKSSNVSRLRRSMRRLEWCDAEADVLGGTPADLTRTANKKPAAVD